MKGFAELKHARLSCRLGTTLLRRSQPGLNSALLWLYNKKRSIERIKRIRIRIRIIIDDEEEEEEKHEDIDGEKEEKDRDQPKKKEMKEIETPIGSLDEGYPWRV